jgi:hypothetical protein
MEMGDWYFFTNQVGKICVRIRIRGPIFMGGIWTLCVVYGRRGYEMDSYHSCIKRFRRNVWEKYCVMKEKVTQGDVWKTLWNLMCFLFYFISLVLHFPFKNGSSSLLFDVKYYNFHINLFYFFVFSKNLLFGML